MIRLLNENFKFNSDLEKYGMFYTGVSFKYGEYNYSITIELHNSKMDNTYYPQEASGILVNIWNDDTGTDIWLDKTWDLDEEYKYFEQFYKEYISGIETCSNSMELAEYLINTQNKFIDESDYGYGGIGLDYDYDYDKYDDPFFKNFKNTY